jgi:hypothetical protein
MGDVKTLDFTAYVSARYNVKREMYQGAANPVAIEVYHTAGHTYDVDDMIDSSRQALPTSRKLALQFRQYRILEYPRYRSFAQSFPTPSLFPKASASSAASRSPPISTSPTSSPRMSSATSGGPTS